MDDNAIEQNYRWNMAAEEIWNKLKQNRPDMPHYQKLAMLAQLKASDSQDRSARKIALYTRLVTVFTFFAAIGALLQGVFAALAYLMPHTR